MTEQERKEVESVVQELEKDIDYFTRIDFINLANKFKRDLNTIKSLIPKEGD